jgi:hypothetical protein
MVSVFIGGLPVQCIVCDELTSNNTFPTVGNRRFRTCIKNNIKDYIRVETRQEKSQLVASVVESIQECSARSGGYGFVKKV